MSTLTSQNLRYKEPGFPFTKHTSRSEEQKVVKEVHSALTMLRPRPIGLGKIERGLPQQVAPAARRVEVHNFEHTWIPRPQLTRSFPFMCTMEPGLGISWLVCARRARKRNIPGMGRMRSQKEKAETLSPYSLYPFRGCKHCYYGLS